MKQQLARLAARIDALSLRERVLVFAAAAALIVSAAYFTVLGPSLTRYLLLREQVGQQKNNLAGLDGEIVAKLHAYQRDPDAENRERLAKVNAESAQLGENLRAMQKGLVAPERMGVLLDTILRANGRLQLVSMKTLPVTSLNQQAQEDPARPARAAPAPAATAALVAVSGQASPLAQALVPPPAKPAAPGSAVATAAIGKPGSLLYRHGVQITVRGNYLDMIDYMGALEALPTQLFWGSAQLEVEEYPVSRLTLTLHTLSLDQKWMKL